MARKRTYKFKLQNGRGNVFGAVGEQVFVGFYFWEGKRESPYGGIGVEIGQKLKIKSHFLYLCDQIYIFGQTWPTYLQNGVHFLGGDLTLKYSGVEPQRIPNI